jgi:hypothetical protein
MIVKLPESVHRFCREERVRTAVNLLLSGRSPKLPEGLGWTEVPDFYRACLAAQQTRIEWAIALEELWRVLWSGQLPGWTPKSIREQATNSSIKLDVQSLWDTDEFIRDFTRNGLYLQTLVELDRQYGARVAVALWKDDMIFPLVPPQRCEDIEGWLYSPWTMVDDGAVIDTTAMQETAAEIMRAVDQVPA